MPQDWIPALLAVLFVGWASGSVAARFGYPAVLGELLGGILLGPGCLALLGGTPGDAVDVLAHVGVLLLMLYIGMEIDPRELARASRVGLLAAVGGFVTPAALGFGVILWFDGSTMSALFVGLAVGVTALITNSRMLIDLHLLDTRIGHVILAGGLISDTICLVMLAGIVSFAETKELDYASLFRTALQAIAFFVAAALIGWKVFPVGGRLLDRLHLTGRTTGFTLVILTALVFGEMAEIAGLHAILGTFMAGLFLRDTVLRGKRSREVSELVKDVSLGFLAPLFFVISGFKVTFDVFTNDLGLLAAVIVVATLGKIIGTALFYLPSGHGWREGITIGAGMNGRGAVEIIVAGIGLELGLIDQQIFSILVFMAILTTATVPVTLSWCVRWLQRRGELVRPEERRRGIVIIGATATARQLAKVLGKEQPVTLVDANPARCERATEEGLTAIAGSALDEACLLAANAYSARSFLALTANAQVNVLAARIAHEECFIPEIFVLVADSDEGEEQMVALEHLGATMLFGGPAWLAAWDHRVDSGAVGPARVPVAAGATAASLLAGARTTAALPIAIERAGMVLPFHAGFVPAEGDVLLVLREPVSREIDPFDLLLADAPILDLPSGSTRAELFAVVARELGRMLGVAPGQIAHLLEERETMGSTVLADGLAVPHVILDGESRFGLVVARSRTGMTFAAAESAPVHMIFVLAGSADQRSLHLRALAAIAQIAQQPGIDARWRSAADSAALRNLLLAARRTG